MPIRFKKSKKFKKNFKKRGNQMVIRKSLNFQILRSKQRTLVDAVCDVSGNYYLNINFMDPTVPWTDTNGSAQQPVTDFSSMVSIYDMYRVYGINCKFIPQNNSTPAFLDNILHEGQTGASGPIGPIHDVVPGAGLLGNLYNPMYSIIDYNEIQGTTFTEAQLLGYDNLKFNNMYRPFKHYFKIPTYSHNPYKVGPAIDPLVSVQRGWYPTSGPFPSYGIIHFQSSFSVPTGYTLGKFLITFYMKFRHRR